MKVDILAIGAHPDDVELSCSGTLARHMAMGKKAAILDLTRGELGTRGSAELRAQEAAAAAKILGVEQRFSLDLGDGVFENDHQTRLEIIRIIRLCQPEILLCNALNDRHPDHGRAAKLEADAAFYSGLSRIETLHNGKSQDAWRPKAVYHYIQDHFIHPDFVVDVTPYMDVRQKSIMAYSSQFYNPDSKEPETPISSKSFLEHLNAKMSIWGRSIGVNYAEGFNTARYPGIDNLFDLR